MKFLLPLMLAALMCAAAMAQIGANANLGVRVGRSAPQLNANAGVRVGKREAPQVNAGANVRVGKRQVNANAGVRVDKREALQGIGANANIGVRTG